MSMDIKNIDGSVLLSVIPDDNAISHEELMTSDYIQIAWQSDENIQIPAGAYIEHEGEKYRILEPYDPTQQDECTYNYNPQFKSRVMAWDKQITPVYTYEDDGTTVKSRDMDWDFTGSPADAMYIVKQAIKNETGEEWTVQLSDSLPATITISSQSASIFAVLNSISSECETEWWADKKTNTLYLSKCIFGDPITLEVGNNVNVPTVQSDNKGYYTRFYAFGSTRNIVQGASQGSAVINNRLTLNPAKYPNGYKDIRAGLKKDEIFPTTLYFDEIYPSYKLTISDVRARLRYRLDNAGQRIQIGGTDEEPIYEQYAIWYFQIADFTFDPITVIEGKNLSVSFESGQLASRDFELTYHEKAETVSDANDVTPFEIKAGDYEIVIDETSGQIIPGVAYIIPQNGDMVILYNIEMPAEYTESAQAELEKELDKAIALQLEDTNSYQFASDPTRFYTDEIDVKMGQSVTFINKGKTLSTRAMMVEKRLDYSCYQTIKVGNKIIKGNTQQLKDEVASVNQNIDVIKAFNDLSASLSQAYANAQREMIEGFAAIKNLWQLRKDESGNLYAYTQYDVLTHGGITQYSAGQAQVPTIWEGIPFDNKTIWMNPETNLVEVIGGTGGGGDMNLKQMWAALSAETNEQINKSHLTTALQDYATQDWVTKQGYATKKDLEKDFVTIATEQEVSGLKHFTAGLSVGAGKHKLYEEDGVVYFDGDLAVTGGITQYATDGVSVSTIMDGVVTDNVTIKKENGKLVVIGGSGSSFDKTAMWAALSAATNEQINHSHLTTALQDYATQSWANSNFPTRLGVGASGTWGIDISGTATNANKLGNTPLTNNKQWWGSVPFVATDGTFEIGKYIDFHNANGESNDYSTRLQCSGAHVNIVNLPSGNGTLALLSDNVASATKLQTPRTLWGRSFDGTNNVTGTLSNVSGINFTGDAPYNLDSNANFKATSNSDNTYWHIDRYDGTQIIKILSSSGKMLLNHVDGVNFHNEGASCLDKNGNVKMTINNLSYYWCILGLDGVPLFVANSNTKNIGLGTDRPSQKLHVVGGTKLEGNVFFKNDGFKMDDYGNMEATVNNEGYYWGVKKIDGNSAFCVTAVNGNVGINITNPSQKLHVNGNILSTGGITQYSDSRAKTIIEQITLSLQSIAQSPAIRFRWNGWKQKDDGKTHIGGIAQYIQKILPEAIYNSDDVLTMDYATTSYIFAVSTAKHLLKYETRTDKEIKKLKKRVIYLENKLKEYGSKGYNN